VVVGLFSLGVLALLRPWVRERCGGGVMQRWCDAEVVQSEGGAMRRQGNDEEVLCGGGREVLRR
jgi:hypothetical protein